MTASDLRYGRRGGGWLPDGHDPRSPHMPAPPKEGTATASCRVCGRTFRYQTTKDSDAPPPPTCGQLTCHARQYWTPADWAGRARMARARLAAGRVLRRGPLDEDGNRPFEWHPNPLDDLDHEALRRTDQGPT